MIGPTPYLNKPPNVAIPITFPAFTTSLDPDGDYQYLITSHITGDPNTLGSYEVLKEPDQLTITPLDQTQDFVVTIIPFNQYSNFAGVVALSKSFKYLDLYTQAKEDAKIDETKINHHERFLLVNRAVITCVAPFYGLVSKDYNTRNALTLIVSGSEATADITTLPVMRVGGQVRYTIEMENSDGGSADPVTEEQYLAFRASNSRDRSVIVFVARATELRFKKGADVSTWGSAYAWFPRIPLAWTTDEDWADVPDAIADLIILKLSMLLRSRAGMPQQDVQPQVDRIVQALSGSLAQSISSEEVKQKVKALL